MTRQEHIDRHKLLHKCLDELFADFIKHHPDQAGGYLDVTLSEFTHWSYKQTTNPDELKEFKEDKGSE